MVSSALLLWFILPFALARQEHQQQESQEAYQTAVALYFLSFTTSFFFFLFLSVLCIRWRISRRAASRVDGNILLHVVQSVNSRRTSGIDENLIKSLPLFQFSTLGCSSDGPVECAICLSKFESTDDVRLLPKCMHTFHMQCIDRWLQQHSNCPVCRQKVEVQDSSSSIPLPETQSSSLMEQGTTQRPNGESLNRDRGGSAVGDNRDAQTPVRIVEDHLLDRRLMQQLQSYGIESVCSSSDQFLQ